MKYPYKNVETKLIHAGEAHPPIAGADGTTIFQSSTFENADDLIADLDQTSAAL